MALRWHRGALSHGEFESYNARTLLLSCLINRAPDATYRVWVFRHGNAQEIKHSTGHATLDAAKLRRWGWPERR